MRGMRKLSPLKCGWAEKPFGPSQDVVQQKLQKGSTVILILVVSENEDVLSFVLKEQGSGESVESGSRWIVSIALKGEYSYSRGQEGYLDSRKQS